MDNGKGKCASNSHGDDDEINKIDLTLKLGPSVNYNQNQEAEDDATSRGVQGFSTTACQSFSDNTGNWNGEYGSSANYNWTREALVYDEVHGQYGPAFPYNNVATTTPPNRKRPIADDNKACKACGSNNTPLWRKGPHGPQTLCNACGLRHLRTIKRGGE